MSQDHKHTRRAYVFTIGAVELVVIVQQAVIICTYIHKFRPGLNFMAQALVVVIIGIISVRCYRVSLFKLNMATSSRVIRQCDDGLVG